MEQKRLSENDCLQLRNEALERFNHVKRGFVSTTMALELIEYLSAALTEIGALRKEIPETRKRTPPAEARRWAESTAKEPDGSTGHDLGVEAIEDMLAPPRRLLGYAIKVGAKYVSAVQHERDAEVYCMIGLGDFFYAHSEAQCVFPTERIVLKILLGRFWDSEKEEHLYFTQKPYEVVPIYEGSNLGINPGV